MSLLSVEGLSVSYGSGRQRFTAIHDLDLELRAGEVTGLVGESGSGKSTLAKAIMGLVPLDRGEIRLNGRIVSKGKMHRDMSFRRSVQLIFQNPYSSLNPRMTIGRILAESMEVRGSIASRNERSEVGRLLQLVGMDENAAHSYPHQFSGGQRQRIAIARALAAEPELIIADEITSALDLTTQATILNLIRELADKEGVALLTISHNLGVVRNISSRVAVMHLGQVVETGMVEEVFDRPRHPYTAALLDAMPVLDRDRKRKIRLIGEPADPHQPPTGCSFHPRCPWGPAAVPGRGACVEVKPALSFSPGGNEAKAACHFPLDPAQVEQPAAGK